MSTVLLDGRIKLGLRVAYGMLCTLQMYLVILGEPLGLLSLFQTTHKQQACGGHGIQAEQHAACGYRALPVCLVGPQNHSVNLILCHRGRALGVMSRGRHARGGCNGLG